MMLGFAGVSLFMVGTVIWQVPGATVVMAVWSVVRLYCPESRGTRASRQSVAPVDPIMGVVWGECYPESAEAPDSQEPLQQGLHRQNNCTTQNIQGARESI